MRTYTEELITPEIAREYLTYNTHNRGLKRDRIVLFKEEMLLGRWRLNGEGIVFSKSGVLLDGQNRLHAIIAADIPVWMLVVRGVEDEVRESMGTGTPRSLADALKLRGERRVTALGAVIRSLYLWDRGTKESHKRALGRGLSHPVSNSTMLAYFEERADQFREIVSVTESIRHATHAPTSVTAPLVREMQNLDPDDAKDFWYRVEQGIPSPRNYEAKDPIVQLNASLKRMIEAKSGYNPTEMGALIVKAWNLYRSGEAVGNLRWRTGGAAPEPFPELV